MSLSRKLLESLGLEADKVSTIIEAHAETVDSLKSQIEQYKGNAERAESLEKELKATQTELEGLKSTGGDWQKKYEALNTEFEAFKTEQNDRAMKQTKESAYRKLLLDTGISEKRIDSILKVTRLDDIGIGEDGQILDADTIAESIKSEWSDFITTSETSGATTTTPPTNNGLRRFTHEEISQMSPEEINANWDSIKESMKN